MRERSQPIRQFLEAALVGAGAFDSQVHLTGPPVVSLFFSQVKRGRPAGPRRRRTGRQEARHHRVPPRRAVPGSEAAKIAERRAGFHGESHEPLLTA
ncbi:hypothetical protein SMC26_14490 [Actinomadura fulvescens]|uniref:Uncharacterized protein n=1 Tax=Actinomadura fulvescens TaxID=46160 RepID=A0ABP6CG81_9ACTN